MKKRAPGIVQLGLGILCCLVVGCSHTKVAQGRKPSLANSQLKQMYDAIDARDAQKLFSLLSPDEIQQNGLTVSKLGKLLDIYDREVKSYEMGPIIYTGDERSAWADRIFKDRKKYVYGTLLSWEKGKGGYMAIQLVCGAAAARGYQLRDKSVPRSRLDAEYDRYLGLKALRDELIAAGITSISENGEPPKSIDRYIRISKKFYKVSCEKIGVPAKE